jgi:ribosomal protein S18 acetylase RimI-like enzyme
MTEIKKLNEDRWQDFRDLRLEALKSDPIAFSSSHEEEQLLPESAWRERIKSILFAVSDNTPIGMVAIFHNNRIKTNHVCEIWGMYVRREYRGQGIGHKLMAAVLEEIPKLKGVAKIKIGVNPTQKAAEHLYRKYGFKAAGHFKKDMCVNGTFYDELFMEKLYDPHGLFLQPAVREVL